MNLKSFCPHTQITVYFFTTNTEWLRQLVWAWPRVIWDKLIRRSCSITAAHTSKLWVPRGPFPVNTIKKKKIPLCHSHQELLPWTKKQNNKQKKTTWWVREPFMEIMQVKKIMIVAFMSWHVWGKGKRRKYCLNKSHLWES